MSRLPQPAPLAADRLGATHGRWADLLVVLGWLEQPLTQGWQSNTLPDRMQIASTVRDQLRAAAAHEATNLAVRSC